MPWWTVEEPRTLGLDGVVAAKVRLMAGSLSVLATEEAPAVHVGQVSGQPLLVRHEAGILTVTYEDLTWDGLLKWLRPQRRSAAVTLAVPHGCPVQLGVVSVDTVVSGLRAKASMRSISGNVTLDEVAGQVDANTVSGDLEARELDGGVNFTTVSGELTVASGTLDRLTAKSVSGDITADVALSAGSYVQVGTVSGDVALRIPDGGDSEVDLRSTSGRIDTSFDQLRHSDRAGASSVTGQLGDGSGTLWVSSVSGNLTLLRKDDADGGDASDLRA